jgi:hypothetical protein
MDTFKLMLTANAEAGGEYDVNIKQVMTLAGLQDMIGSIIEATPEASSFLITVVRQERAHISNGDTFHGYDDEGVPIWNKSPVK